jgi:hypothetical protein
MYSTNISRVELTVISGKSLTYNVNMSGSIIQHVKEVKINICK